MSRLLHALGLCGCATGESWRVDGVCVPVVTSQYEREQRALAQHRADRRAVLAIARRGHVEVA